MPALPYRRRHKSGTRFVQRPASCFAAANINNKNGGTHPGRERALRDRWASRLRHFFLNTAPAGSSSLLIYKRCCRARFLFFVSLGGRAAFVFVVSWPARNVREGGGSARADLLFVVFWKDCVVNDENVEKIEMRRINTRRFDVDNEWKSESCSSA